MKTKEEIIKYLKESKYMLCTDNCGCAGRLIELPAIKKLVEELEAEK